MNLFNLVEPNAPLVPLVISVPHAGVGIPEDIKGKFDSRMVQLLDDTDWFVDKLYSFATELGITVISANLSRWVIDLNRDPISKPLYNDGRLITGITPSTDFFGNDLYREKSDEPDQAEIEKRLEQYYWPYYQKIEEILEDRKKAFGKVLLWDGHSIRHRVSTIQADPFPDMILGNNDQKTADKKLIDSALATLRSGTFQVNHNSPFRGGHITRYFGKPENDIHALQLEMNKILYMDDNELTFNKERAERVIGLLEKTMKELIKTLQEL